jgi:type III restriction enzyme
LLLQPVVDHIVKIFAFALTDSREDIVVGDVEVRYRRLSEASRITLRESTSIKVEKCIYPRLPYPAHSGGLEKAFIEWAQSDAAVLAFCKISETRHEFARLRYIKDDGLAAFYSPDFMVRSADAIYVVETKAQQQVSHPNVQRKLKAAVAWCERVNALPAALRSELPWHYVLLGENLFYDWRDKKARLADLLNFARVRPQASAAAQAELTGL